MIVCLVVSWIVLMEQKTNYEDINNVQYINAKDLKPNIVTALKRSYTTRKELKTRFQAAMILPVGIEQHMFRRASRFRLHQAGWLSGKAVSTLSRCIHRSVANMAASFQNSCEIL
jgi:hypothetical protein